MDTDTIRWLALTTAEIIQEKFPGRAVLTPDEVAEVWKGERTRSACEGIRQRLKAGTLIPGLKKNGGRWEVPVADLVKVIDDLTRPPADHAPGYVPTQRHADANVPGVRPRIRQRSPLGPRLGVLDFQSFWREVFEELDYFDAQALREEMRRQLNMTD